MKRFLKILAYGYSILFYPLFVPTYIMIFYCMVYGRLAMPLTDVYVWLAVGGTFFFTCFVPLILLLIMKAMGKVKDLDVSDRKDRTEPYLYSVLCYGMWAYFLHVMRMPDFVIASAIATIIVLLLVTAITIKWKISAHLASAGGAIAMVIGIMLHFEIVGTSIIPILLVLAWLLMLARIYLEAHTPLQTVCGFLLGLIAVLIPNMYLLLVASQETQINIPVIQ